MGVCTCGCVRVWMQVRVLLLGPSVAGGCCARGLALIGCMSAAGLLGPAMAVAAAAWASAVTSGLQKSYSREVGMKTRLAPGVPCCVAICSAQACELPM